MNERLQLLRETVPPPTAPVLATGDWSEVERRLQIDLPPDYKHFISLYGSGAFSCNLSVYNYLDHDDYSQVGSFLHHFTALHQQPIENRFTRSSVRFIPEISESELPFPIPIFPAPKGLLPWGTAPDRWEFCWLTTGKPSDWKTVVLYESVSRIYTFPPMNLVHFLSELATRPFSADFLLVPPFYPKDVS